MKLDQVKPITNIAGHDEIDLLNKAIRKEVQLFTVVKTNLTVDYDYIEFHTCPYTQEEQMVVLSDREISKDFIKEELIPLSIEALKELRLWKKLDKNNLYLVFEPPDANHKIHSTHLLDEVHLNDVYIVPKSLRNNSSRSQRSKAPHTQAIEAAISKLGKNASNIDIYEWIKKHSQNPSDDMKSFMNYLDFEDDDLDPFTVTDQKASILKSNDKPLSKQAFQDICAKAKRKK
jgi:hypothetical protein